MADDSLIHDRAAGIERLLQIMARLRDPETGLSLGHRAGHSPASPPTPSRRPTRSPTPSRREAWDELEAELGDLLLQTVYHTQMAPRRAFRFQSVAPRSPTRWWRATRTSSATKAATRAPNSRPATGRRSRPPNARARPRPARLTGWRLGLPALLRALKLQTRAARVGFDWPDADEVLDKIVEEARELAEARKTSTPMPAKRNSAISCS
jgi:ATP diphosphatase